MKPGAGAAEKLSQAADADHMDRRAWQRENQIERGAKAQADIDLPVLFAEYLFRILLASGKNGGIFSGSRDRMCVETAGH